MKLKNTIIINNNESALRDIKSYLISIGISGHEINFLRLEDLGINNENLTKKELIYYIKKKLYARPQRYHLIYGIEPEENINDISINDINIKVVQGVQGLQKEIFKKERKTFIKFKCNNFLDFLGRNKDNILISVFLFFIIAVTTKIIIEFLKVI